jgi:hypothetical protein
MPALRLRSSLGDIGPIPTVHSSGLVPYIRGADGRLSPLFTRFVQVLCQVDAIAEFLSHFDTAPEQTMANAFFAFAQDIRATPPVVRPPRDLFDQFARALPQVMHWRASEATTTLAALFATLAEAADSPVDFGPLVNTSVDVVRICRHCHKDQPCSRAESVLRAEIIRKKFTHPSLRECIAAALRSPRDEDWVCPSCGAKGPPKESARIGRLPHVLIVSLHRIVRDGQALTIKTGKVTYSTQLKMGEMSGDPADRYALMGVITLAGEAKDPKFKAFAYRKDVQSWVFFSESNLIPTNAKGVIFSRQACLFVHERIAGT